MPLYVLELEHILNKDNKIFFDEKGNAYYGKNVASFREAWIETKMPRIGYKRIISDK